MSTGRQLGIQILEALGVPTEGVTSVSINMEPDDLATVTVVRAIDRDEAGKIIESLQRYALHELPATKCQP
ncbi:hypothetical protein ACUTAF_02080 [Pseudomonas sp. SP16.1]|uniref:hypothetical protein n=1 Tax=Pseudomonas sp. SP16.1 TaxID=3458854 RepID=UPI004045BA53